MLASTLMNGLYEILHKWLEWGESRTRLEKLWGHQSRLQRPHRHQRSFGRRNYVCYVIAVAESKQRSLAIFSKRLKTHLFRLHLDPTKAWLLTFKGEVHEMKLLNGCLNSGGFCLAVSVSTVHHIALKVILTILFPIVTVIIVLVWTLPGV